MNREVKRLIEDLRFNGHRLRSISVGGFTFRRDYVRRQFANAIAVDASVAFRAMDEIDDGRILETSDFPCAVPPWKKAIVAGRYRSSKKKPLCPTAFLYESFDTSVPAQRDAATSLIDRMTSGGMMGGRRSEKVATLEDFDDARWVVFVVNALRVSGISGVLDAVSAVAINGDGTASWRAISQGSCAEELTRRGTPWTWAEVQPLLMAFSMANCKNIVAEDVAATRHLPRGKRKGKDPRYTYKVLRIADSKGMPHTGDCDGEAGKAMHLCRGHFAHYTDDKPLFGRYTGTFWRPMHVRGSVKHGVVDKDYAI